MNTLNGEVIQQGIILAKAYVIKSAEAQIVCEQASDSGAELCRLGKSLEAAKAQLAKLYDAALQKVGEADAEIFNVHIMMLEDETFIDEIKSCIENESMTAETAVARVKENFAAMFEGMDDEYMSARANDVRDISSRLISNLTGAEQVTLAEPAVIIADDLTPSDVIGIDTDKILGLATIHGSNTSHTAILARNLGVPTLFNLAELDLSEIKTGDRVVLDANAGKLIINPDADAEEQAKQKMNAEAEAKSALEKLRGVPDETLSGQKVKLCANIAGPEDVDRVHEGDANGIGLFRTEFLYMDRKTLPTEEEQFEAYKEVLSRMEGKDVVIRTMDIGADKKVDCLEMPAEENPALGRRAIRICLEDTELFRTQLRALLRSAPYGKLFIMYPMITSAQEIMDIKEQVKIAAAELDERGEKYEIPAQGIMIETPAAALISDELAKIVDFFSIGTNDLTQYTTACDRQNSTISRFTNSQHPAVLRLIKIACENAHANNIWCGICGELAGDTELTETWVEMGIDELSMSAKKVLAVRRKLREIK